MGQAAVNLARARGRGLSQTAIVLPNRDVTIRLNQSQSEKH